MAGTWLSEAVHVGLWGKELQLSSTSAPLTLKAQYAGKMGCKDRTNSEAASRVPIALCSEGDRNVLVEGLAVVLIFSPLVGL